MKGDRHVISIGNNLTASTTQPCMYYVCVFKYLLFCILYCCKWSWYRSPIYLYFTAQPKSYLYLIASLMVPVFVIVIVILVCVYHFYKKYKVRSSGILYWVVLVFIRWGAERVIDWVVLVFIRWGAERVIDWVVLVFVKWGAERVIDRMGCVGIHKVRSREGYRLGCVLVFIRWGAERVIDWVVLVFIRWGAERVIDWVVLVLVRWGAEGRGYKLHGLCCMVFMRCGVVRVNTGLYWYSYSLAAMILILHVLKLNIDNSL